MYEGEIAAVEARRDERTHLFLIATLYAGKSSAPVRVRNLSRRGALIETTILPAVGSEVTLRRGKLEAHGHAEWASAGKAGISFSSPVMVSAWLPISGSAAQKSADQFSYALRQPGPAKPRGVGVDLPPANSNVSLAAELKALQSGLEDLGDKLSQDIIFVATHPEVQFLDYAIQRLTRLVETIAPADQ